MYYMNKDKRDYFRMLTDIPCVLYDENFSEIPCIIKNLSENGILLECNGSVDIKKIKKSINVTIQFVDYIPTKSHVEECVLSESIRIRRIDRIDEKTVIGGNINSDTFYKYVIMKKASSFYCR